MSQDRLVAFLSIIFLFSLCSLVIEFEMHQDAYHEGISIPSGTTVQVSTQTSAPEDHVRVIEDVPRNETVDYKLNASSSTVESSSKSASTEFDVVFAWVNGSDPQLQASINKYTDEFKQQAKGTVYSSLAAQRFRDNDELRYAFRSIHKFAPWVRNIYILTNGQVPSWLNTSFDNIHIVTHSQIIDEKYLPTFSSRPLALSLHKIPGISDKFLYLNDDFMFGNDVYPEDFYTPKKGIKIYESWDLPACSNGCSNSQLANGKCNQECNNQACDYDVGDCGKPPSDTEKTLCGDGCEIEWIGDGVCDTKCKNVECGYDAGDCGDEYTKLMNGYTFDVNVPITIPGNTSSFFLDLKNLNRNVEGMSWNLTSTDNRPIDNVIISQTNTNLYFVFPATAIRSSVLLTMSYFPISHSIQFSLSCTSTENWVGCFSLEHSFRHSNITEYSDGKSSNDAHEIAARRSTFLINRKFGFMHRKEIAHVPYFIDKQIMKEVELLWPDLYESTLTHRFRHGHDLKIIFLYLNYALQAPLEFHFDEFFSRIDANNDQSWDKDEMYTNMKQIFSSQSMKKFDELYQSLSKCSEKDHLDKISKSSVSFCEQAIVILKEMTKSTPKYKTERVSALNKAYFMMVTSNPKRAKDIFSTLKATRTKFMCFNDDKATPSPAVDRLFHEFVEDYFPEPSPYELQTHLTKQ